MNFPPQVGKKLSKSASGLRMVPISENFASPFALLEPLWIPDKQCDICRSCNAPFDFLNRRHHCRRCGVCFCQRCCHYHIRLYRMYFIDPVRQCYDCAIMSKSECEFYEKSLMVLMKGIPFVVFDDDDKKIGEFTLYLSNDQRYLRHKQLDAIKSTLLPIPTILLANIISVKFSMEADENNSTNPVGFVIKFKDENDSDISHRLRFHCINKREAKPWLSSLQKAMKLIYETRDSSETY